MMSHNFKKSQNYFLAILLVKKSGKVVHIDQSEGFPLKKGLEQGIYLHELIERYFNSQDAKCALERFKKVAEGDLSIPCRIVARKKGDYNSRYHIIYTVIHRSGQQFIQLILNDLQDYDRKRYEYSFYNDFLTHEMNNILSNMNMALALSNKIIQEKIDNKKLKEMYDIIESQIFRGRRIISIIRKLTKLENRDVKLEEQDLLEVLRKCIQYIRKTYYKSNLDIKVESPFETITIFANQLLFDVFQNILINAIKHNKHLEVKIKIKFSQVELEQKTYLKVKFIDNGTGIPDSKKRLLFKPLQRKSLSSKGMGIGLSLVKKIIDAYGGKIWVKNRIKGDYPKGSVFVLLFPVKGLS